MVKVFNTLNSPVLINDDGKTLDGYTWFEGDDSSEIQAAAKRGELIKVDSQGNIIYDSNDTPVVEPEDPSKPLNPEDASKKNSRK